MNGKTRRAAAMTLLVGTTAICLASIPGIAQTLDVEMQGAWGFRGFGLVAAMIFALAGALLAFKRPENPVGWLFGAIGAAFALMTAGETYAVIPLIEGNDAGIRYHLAWLTSWGWVIFLGLIAFSILLFPSGHLPNPRWIPWARAMVVGFALGALSFAVGPASLNNMPPRITNRYSLPPGPAAETFVNIGMLLFMGALGAAAVGAIQRYRSSQGLQRQQMKLFAFAASAMAITMVMVVMTVMFVPRLGDAAEILSSVAMMSIPVAMTIAILRYRLYDIDVVINRTLVYATLTGLLALAYLVIVVLLQTVVAPITKDSDLAVAGSTLAVAALFRPLRGRVQTFIDQRFYRSRYDTAETVSAFSAHLRDEVDLGSLTQQLVQVVQSTMQPAHASLWLKVGDHAPDGDGRPLQRYGFLPVVRVRNDSQTLDL